ncbi:MAG: hypothetical protein U0234_20445 [Sandaracinus sp.]
MRPRLPLLAVLGVLALGCASVQPLAGTLSYARLPEGAAPRPEDFEAAVAGAEGPRDDVVLARVATGPASWVVWARSGPGARLIRVERTSLGLEVRDARWLAGVPIRPTLSAWPVGPLVIVVAERSDELSSTTRRGALFSDDGARLSPLALGDVDGELAIRVERRTPVGDGWERVATCTTTLASDRDGLLLHEHATVREIALARPELPARSTHEVERARRLRVGDGALVADRPSLFDGL